MSTTRATIRSWAEEGVNRGASHMIVMTDTYDWEDYPVFVSDPVHAWSEINDPGNMQKVQEVYDLNDNLDGQIRRGRAYNPPPKPQA